MLYIIESKKEFIKYNSFCIEYNKSLSREKIENELSLLRFETKESAILFEVNR